MTQVRAEVRASGRVQGVWFRQSTKLAAEQYDVSGWVRNCPDGSVEAILEGEESSVQKLVDWCRQGPQLAQVDELQVVWTAATGEFNNFQVR